MEMIEIPAGEFLRGEAGEPGFVDAFKMARYPVTNQQYQTFLQALDPWQRTTIALPKSWGGNRVPPGEEDHPVTFVNWYEALSFAKWSNVRLPTELEWEKAARGGLVLAREKNPDPQRRYPWGNAFDSGKCNTAESSHGHTTPVHRFPNGISPYGVFDLCGNIWEWCSTLFETQTEDLTAYGSRVLRGGAWDVDAVKAQCTYRYRHNMEYRLSSVGFRCAADV